MIAVGADHGGAGLEYARAVAERVGRDDSTRGVQICTSGIGMALATNEFPGVRPARAAVAGGRHQPRVDPIAAFEHELGLRAGALR